MPNTKTHRKGGSRGANGVIVITTKKGKAGKVQMQYRGQIGYGAAPSLNNLRMMNTNERLQFEEDILGGGTSATVPTSPAGVYPDGPDILYVVATPLTTTSSTILARLSWKEAQA
jgi:hypothetical protein